MVELAGLTVSKSRNQTVGRDQDLGSLTFPARSYKLPTAACCKLEPLTQEDLDSAEPQPLSSELNGKQVIDQQKTLLGVLLYRKRLARDEIKAIKAEMKAKRKSAWAKALASHRNTLKKVYWKKERVNQVLPEKRRRVRDPHNDTFKIEVKTGLLPVRRKDGTYDQTNLVWTTRRIKHRVKAYKSVIIKPLRIKQRNVRVKTIVDTTDWGAVHWDYAKAVNAITGEYSNRLKLLRDRISGTEVKIGKIVQNHYCMRSFTTAFCAGFKSTQDWTSQNHLTFLKPQAEVNRTIRQWAHVATSTGIHGRGEGTGDCVRSVGLVAAHTAPLYIPGVQSLAPNTRYLLASSLEELRALEQNVINSEITPSFKDGDTTQYPIASACTVMPPKLLDLDGITSNNVETAERLAAANVMALRGAKDFVFNLARSVGELKDMRETWTQGREFIVFCKDVLRGKKNPPDELLKAYLAEINDRRIYGTTKVRDAYSNPEVIAQMRDEIRKYSKPKLSTWLKLTARQLIGLHLAWKFAVAPSIDDVDTVLSQSIKWLLETRRLCSKMIDTQRQSTTLHMRSKWRLSREREHKEFRVVDNPMDSKERTKKCDGYVTLELPRPSLRDWSISEGELPPTFHEPSLSFECLNFDNGDQLSIHAEWFANDARITVGTNGTNARVKTPGMGHDVSAPSLGGFVTRASDVTGQPVDYATGEELSKALIGSFSCESFAIEEARGVVFANYRIDDVLEFLDSSSHGLLGKLKDYLDKTQFLVTAWELTPLSFIEDWFVNSGSLAKGLQNLVSAVMVETPDAEIWATRKFELLTGCPTPRLTDEKFRGRILDWYEVRTVIYDPFGNRTETYLAYPRTVRFEAARLLSLGDKIVLGPSAHRRAMRGAFTADHNQWFMLRPRVNLNQGKLVTLAEMLSGLLL